MIVEKIGWRELIVSSIDNYRHLDGIFRTVRPGGTSESARFSKNIRAVKPGKVADSKRKSPAKAGDV